MRALETALTRHTELSADRVCLSGGSHGGFLVTSLIGQQPDMFRACATRNPVTNLLTLEATSDIPDWALVETMGRSAYRYVELRLKMYASQRNANTTTSFTIVTIASNLSTLLA